MLWFVFGGDFRIKKEKKKVGPQNSDRISFSLGNGQLRIL